MSTTGAAGDGLFRGMFEGCISAGDMGIQRRPYHKNCKCALHKDRRDRCAHSARYTNVSYPMRRAWSDGCLALMNNNAPPAASSPTSPRLSSPTVADIQRAQTHLSLCKEEEDEDSHPLSLLSYKV